MSENMQSASYEIWETKYQLKDKDGNAIDQTLDDTFRRVAKGLASVENEPEKAEEKFLWAMRNGAVPAGRILSNVGAGEHKPNTSTINCTVSATVVDSMLGIMNTVKEAGLTLAAGCGIGYDFSTLRPKGAFVAGVGAQTSGVLSFMNIYDSMCFTVASAGGRRGAQMGTMDISHPDVMDFIKAKREDGRLRQFNLSLLITDEFMEAVKNDSDWVLHFPLNRRESAEGSEVVVRPHPYVGDNMISDGKGVVHKIYGKVRARELWDTIMKSTYDYAEPGFILIDKVNKDNNLWFCENIRTTNPCVPGNTPILTDKGYFNISDKLGETVRVWNGEEWSEVVPQITGHSQPMVKVTLSDGSSLVCTTAHKWILKGRRVEASNLEVGDSLEKFSFPVVNFGTEVDAKEAYTQGVFSGDGCVNSSKCGRKEIWLYGKKQALLPRMTYENAWEDEKSDRMAVTVSKELKGKTFVPFEWSLEARLNWLAGLADSDGCVNSSDGSLSISSIDKEFLLNCKLLLSTMGASSCVSLMKKAEVKAMPDGKGGVKDYSTVDCHRLTISAFNVEGLLKLGLHLSRVSVSPAPNRNASRFLKVVSIEDAGTCETVYCFTESKRHAGIFNGILTGQCGEQPLPPYGACLLGSINLTKMIEKPFTHSAAFDWQKFKSVIRIFTRMLDNVVEMHGLPLPEQAEEIRRKRRHGMGFLGLGSAMAMLRMRYGSKESLEFASKVAKTLAVEGWEEGVRLAIHKGPAPIMEETFEVEGKTYKGKELFIKSEYLKRVLNAPVLEDIARYGARFSHHTSIAPTGTISLSIGNNCSNGIEPSFNHEYVRNVIKKGRTTKEPVTVYSYEAWLWKKLYPQMPYPDYFCTAETISPEDHVAVQAAVQPWIDSSISKTVNVPTDIDFERFKNLYLQAYESGLKGCTTFRFNPEAFQGVLVNKKDLANTFYEFTLESGEVVQLRGDEEVEYDGHTHTAANLFDAIKEGYYGRL